MASVYQRLMSRFSKKAVDFDADMLAYFAELQVIAGNTFVTYHTALRVSVAFACARVIAEGLAMLPCKVMRQEGRVILPATAHSLYDLLMVSPNPLQTAFEFYETMGLHLAFCGNAYAWINRVRGQISEIYLLEPSWVHVKRGKWPELPTYEIKAPSGLITLQADEVWHIRGPSWCAYLGLDFIDLARRALGLSMAIEDSQTKLQAQGIRPSGLLSIEGNLVEGQYEKLRAWLNKEHSGTVNSGKPMILDRAAKFTSMTMSNVDAQTIEQRKFQVEEVCRFFRVMPIMAGFSDKTSTYASAEQMFIAHTVHTMGPWLRRVEQSIDKSLLSKEDRNNGFYSKFNEKALQRMTAKDQMEVLARGTAAGIYVRNEARERLDLNPLPGLDEPLTPVNTVAGEPPRVDLTPKPASDTDPDIDE